MKTAQARNFEVTPPPLHAWWIMALLLLVPAVAVVAILFGHGKEPDPEAAIGTGVALVVIALVSLFSGISLKRRRVHLQSGVLQVAAGLFSHRVSVGDIDLERARVVDLEGAEVTLLLRTPLPHTHTHAARIDQRQHRIPRQHRRHERHVHRRGPLRELRPVPQISRTHPDPTHVLTHVRLTREPDELHPVHLRQLRIHEHELPQRRHRD